MSMISGIGTASSYLSSQAMQVTAIRSVPNLQAGEQPFSLDSQPVGAEENAYAEQFQGRPATERQISTDATGIMLSSETREFLATLPESQKIPIVSTSGTRAANAQNMPADAIMPGDLESPVVQNSLAQGQISVTQLQSQQSQVGQQPRTAPSDTSASNTTYSSQARLIGGGASVEQTLVAGQGSVQQNTQERITTGNDTPENSNADGSDKMASTRDSEEFKIAGVENNSEGDDNSGGETSSESNDSIEDAPSTAENELSDEEQEEVRELQARDTEVRAHEQAHVTAGGGLIRGGIQYETTTGPDGKNYAIGGSVNIDTSVDDSSPEAMAAKANKIKAAALAPAEPSSQDRAVAAAATQMLMQAQEAKRQESAEEVQANLESSSTTTEAQSAELPEVEPIEIDSPQNAGQANNTNDTNEELIASNINSGASVEQAEIGSQANANREVPTLENVDERRNTIRDRVITNSMPTSSLQDEPTPTPSEQVSSDVPSESRTSAHPEEASANNASSSTSELQMSPGAERYRNNAISAYQGMRNRAA